MTNPAPRRIEEAQLLKRLHVTSACLARWRKLGCPVFVLGRGSRYYVEDEVRAWMREMRLDGDYPGADTAGKEHRERLLAGFQAELEEAEGDVMAERRVIKKHLEQARLKKELALAQKHEIELRRREGELLEREEVERSRLERVLACKANLLALPGKLAPRLAGRTTVDIHTELELEIRTVLEEFARG